MKHSVVMSSIVEILVYIRLHEKNETRRFQKSDSTPESFQIEKWLHVSLDRCLWKATPPKKIVKFVIFNKHDGKGQGILLPAVWGTQFFFSIQRRGQSKNSIDSEK